jgi:rhodanese-related sulfurtransferase
MDELEITPADVKARMERGEKVHLLDVREPWEYDVCRIEGAKLVPLGALAASLQTLPDVDEVICYCHHGMRSRRGGLAAIPGDRKSEILGRRDRALVA